MPWEETCTMSERMKFIAAYETGEETMTVLCQRFSISRKTGYKWLRRFQQEGIDGLHNKSRAHYSHPATTNEETVQWLLDLKQRYPHWGPNKIHDYLTLEQPEERWPSASTMGDILKKHGLVKSRKKRLRTPPYTKPFLRCVAPNRVWSIDYKGEFSLGDNTRCYPLTITDNYSRFLFCCHGEHKISGLTAKKILTRLFKEFGLPEAIRSDNGTPFASIGIGGLSRLSIWWLKLGILPERIEVGHPEQNGRHERMHLTLKQAVLQPPAKTLQAQQKKFNDFIQEYNYVRPHDGIGKKRPGEIYQPSTRVFPTTPLVIEYPSELKRVKVKPNGCIKFKGKEIYIGGLLAGEPLGMIEVAEDKWQVYFTKMSLGLIDMRTGGFVRAA